MNRIKQSVCWWCYKNSELAPEDLMHTIKEIGYEGIELIEPEYWQMVKDHGLEIAAVAGHSPLEDGLNKRENAAKLEKAILEQLDLAVKWKIPNLIVFSGNRNGLDDISGAEITAENLRHVTQAAENAGVNLLLELLNSKVDHPDFQCDRTEWGVKVIEAVGSPRVKLLYDIYHMQIMEGDVIRTIQQRHSYFGHYHTAGNPGRNELDDTQELYYPAIMQTVLATDFDGFVGQEFVPKGDPVAGLKQAFQLCDLKS